MSKKIIFKFSLSILICILLFPVIYNYYFYIPDEVVINFSDQNSDNSKMSIQLEKQVVEKNDNSYDEKAYKNKKEYKSFDVQAIITNRDNVTINIINNNINVSGQIIQRAIDSKNKLNTGSYISFMFFLPSSINNSHIENMKVILPQSGDLLITEKTDRFIKSKNSNAPYFIITLEFMENQTIPVIIDWGNGKTETYSFNLDIQVLS